MPTINSPDIHLSSVKLRLTLDVTYLPGDESIETLMHHLNRLVQIASSEGLLTGETAAEVDVFDHKVTIAPEEIDEDDLASYFRAQIENGNLNLDDIAVRLARYGLKERFEFLDEMTERMRDASQLQILEREGKNSPVYYKEQLNYSSRKS